MDRTTERSIMQTLLGLMLGFSLSSGMAVPETFPTAPPEDPRGPLEIGRAFPTGNDTMLFDPTQGASQAAGAQMALCDMLMALPVPPPIDQVPWFCVCSRCSGSLGTKGDRGDRGLPGVPGSSGQRGLTGFRGRPGYVGNQGIKGEKGDEGLKGDKGPDGYPGAKGGQGFKGEKGEHGLDGLVGETGPKGDLGQCPDTCVVPPAIPGHPGLPGPVGPRGLPGVSGATGATGLKGDTGSMGPVGVPGILGPKGNQGAEGKCNCTDGAKGAQGLLGPKGDKGVQGLTGALGVKGDTGTKGDHGDMGMMGIPGPCMPNIQSAFSASLNTIYPSPNAPVAFSTVLTNTQNHYDPATGIYMAPINGTYAFSYHLAVFGRMLKVGLFVNYMPVVKTTEASQLGTASQQVLLHLSRFDKVWIQVRDAVTNGMYASSEASSTFTGYLLTPDSCDMVLSREFPMWENKPYDWGDMEGPTTHAPTHAP